VTNIGHESVNHVLPSGRADALLDDGDGPHLQPYDALRFLRGAALPNQLVGRLVEVVADFVGDILVGGGRIRENANAARDVSPQGHVASLLLSIGGRSPRHGGSNLPSEPRAACAPPASTCSTSRAVSCRSAATRRRLRRRPRAVAAR